MTFHPPKKLILKVEVEMTEQQSEAWHRANEVADDAGLVASIEASFNNTPHFSATVKEVLELQEDRGAGWFNVIGEIK
ncbi:hypothetical protein [Nocardia vulneris]|uniref:hypothetical protein n=1 Tax=Nocardia vulneris TaxID=1141657 RepID=UPI000A53B46D|nr:hypothetical protein [Nocardia vulneris]